MQVDPIQEANMFFDLIRKRRSIRKYEPKSIEDEKIQMLAEAFLRAPTSMGKNPWEFVIVTDGELLTKLSTAKPHGASFLKNAALGIVVCADPQVSDVWIEDASIASTFIHLAAASLELGSCWIQIRERPHDDAQSADSYIAGLIGLPEHLRVLSIIAVGYPDESKAGHAAEKLNYEKVKINHYNTPYER
jgi:nitroreductase